MGGRGSGGHNRISKEEHERRNTYRKDRHEAPVPARPLPRAMADWTLATIAGIDRWNMKPICPVRDPPGLMTPAEIARVHRGLHQEYAADRHHPERGHKDQPSPVDSVGDRAAVEAEHDQRHEADDADQTDVQR